jgi:hypothetical protein
MVERYTMSHFSQANPAGERQGDVPALLRRVADSITELGDVKVHDITFHTELLDGKDAVTMAVYYADEPHD